MFCAGMWATATGFGYLQMPAKDPLARQQWQERFGFALRWIGPALLIISVSLIIAKTAGVGGNI